MEAYIKRFSSYRTVKKATVLSSALTLDSLSADASTVTVKGTQIGRSNTGDWLIIDRQVYTIYNVKPQKDRTMLTLMSPLDVFARPLEYEEQVMGQTIGGFVRKMLTDHWVHESDPVYAMPYLVVSNLDATPMAVPELDNSGCFKLVDYCRLMRKSYRVRVHFEDAGDSLNCTIGVAPTVEHQVTFDDGRSQLQSVDYSSTGIAKLTVLQDVDTGEKDSEGEAIMERQRSVWYLSEEGIASRTVPARRASGSWSTISIRGNADVEAKVIETFAKNKSNHKLEFWSTRDLDVQDDCTFYVYGEILISNISYKRKSSEDKRFYYKSGELATTATEKLRGATK